MQSEPEIHSKNNQDHSPQENNLDASQNPRQRKQYFEISEDEQPYGKCYKEVGLQKIEEILTKEYGEQYDKNPQAIRFKKIMRIFMLEVLDGVKDNVRIIGETKGDEDQKQNVKIIYNEEDKVLQEKIENRKNQLLQVLNNYKDKRENYEKQYVQKMIQVLNNMFEPVNQQQHDLNSYQLKIFNKSSKNNSREEETENYEQQNEEQKDYAEFNMVEFMSDYLKDIQAKYQEQQKNIINLEEIIENQNQTILKETRSLCKQSETLTFLSNLGLF